MDDFIMSRQFVTDLYEFDAKSFQFRTFLREIVRGKPSQTFAKIP